MLTLSNLPQDQKPARIKGLLGRLFADAPSAIDLSSTEQEKIATLFENLLIAHYENQAFDIESALQEIFNHNGNPTEQEKMIENELKKAKIRLEADQTHFIYHMLRELSEPLKMTFEAIAKIVPASPEQALLQRITLKVSPIFTSHLFHFFPLFLKIADLNSEFFKELTKCMHPTDQREQLEALNNYFKNPQFQQRKIEKILFDHGLVNSEIESHLVLYRAVYESMAKIEGLQEDFNQLIAADADLEYLSLEFADALVQEIDESPTPRSISEAVSGTPGTLLMMRESVIKETHTDDQAFAALLNIRSEAEFAQKFKAAYSCTTMFTMCNITQTGRMFFHENAIQLTAQKYDSDKNALEAKDLLLMVYLGSPKLKNYIRANRPEFDALCVSRGLKKSLIIEDMVDKKPEITLETLMVQARVPVPLLMSRRAAPAEVEAVTADLKKLNFK